jgi:hypothetical protein
MIPSKISRTVYGRSVSTSHSNSEQRPTCKMTPEQLLGLQHTARAKTATLTPEISIIDPIIIEDEIHEIDVPNPELRSTKNGPGPVGAVVGFALFAAVTAAEILVVVLS